MSLKKDNFSSLDRKYMQLAINLADNQKPLTGTNPAVGCVIVKNKKIISYGATNINGRPHAEIIALNKNKKENFGSTMYLTLEPCTHYGITPPCTDIIIKKKIKKVFFSSYDNDIRSRKKTKKILNKKQIFVKGSLLKKKGKNFYQSYYLQHNKQLPLIDCKIAISKDYYTNNLRKKWITNKYSRKRSHLIRSMYNCIVSTSKSINKDDSLLNCRIEGLENKSPDLVIIDRKLRLKKNLTLFKFIKNRKVLLFTSSKNKKKILFFKKKRIF